MKKVFVSLTVLALMMSVTPALAHDGHNHGGSDITVTNNKSATVSNTVEVIASTGYNYSNGGVGGDGGDTGKAKAALYSGATSGDGGNGGAGGDGGTITTGDATAKAKVKNKVNTDITKIEPCDCGEPSSIDDITVTNNDSANVGNGVGVLADTGVNDTGGNSGGEGGETGKAKAWNHSTATSGDGGNGGAGGNGGTITTGDAYSKAKVVNVVNTIVTRIKY